MTDFSKWVTASPDEPVGAVAQRSLHTRLEAVQSFLEHAALHWQEDPEHVHQLRVWTRRSVAALDLYRPLLPNRRWKRLKKHLKQIRRAANDARDDDVFAERLARDQTDPGARQLLETVLEHRQQAQQPIGQVFERFGSSGRLARRTRQLLKRTGTGPRKVLGATAFSNWAAAQLQDTVHDFFQTSDQELADWYQLHRLRIAGKHLRYTVELLSAAFPKRLRDQVYPLIRDLQDRLGTINDHATAHDRLQHWIEQTAADNIRAYLEQRLETEARLAAKRHQRFLDWWNQRRAAELHQALQQVLPGNPDRR